MSWLPVFLWVPIGRTSSGSSDVDQFCWQESQGGQSEPLLFFAHFYQSTPSCLKVRGGGVVAHVIIVSAQSKELGFGDFQTLSGLLGQDLGLLGQGTRTWTWA